MDHDNLLTNLHDHPALKHVNKELLTLIDVYTKRLRETIHTQNDLIHVLKSQICELKETIEVLERGY